MTYKTLIFIFRAPKPKSEFLSIIRASVDDDLTSASSGILRITRTGLRLAHIYDAGLGWVLLQSFENAFSGAVTIQVGGSTGDNGTFYVESDSIEYDGHLARGQLTSDFQLLLFD